MNQMATMHAHKRVRLASPASPALRPLRLGLVSMSPPMPNVPDCGDPCTGGNAAALGNSDLKSCEQEPLYPGMLPSLKPEAINIEELRRRITKTPKSIFPGLPKKVNLAVPLLRKFCKAKMDLMPRNEFDALTPEARSKKVSELARQPSKYYQWAALTIEMELDELCSISTKHMRLFNRRNVFQFKSSTASCVRSMRAACWRPNHHLGCTNLTTGGWTQWWCCSNQHLSYVRLSPCC